MLNGKKNLTPLSKLPNFDPRKVPVIGTEDHLPPILIDQLFTSSLINRFATPPKWEPEVRSEPRFTDRLPVAASVLIPIVRRAELSVLLTQRTDHLNHHSGQIAFPGGKSDVSDTDAVMTATREAQEEVGLEGTHISIIGSLPTYTTGSAFVVTPVVALVDPTFKPLMNTNEVADVFEVPLAFLMNPANHYRHSLMSQGIERNWFSMPYQHLGVERYIWGATAGILRNFYRFLAA